MSIKGFLLVATVLLLQACGGGSSSSRSGSSTSSSSSSEVAMSSSSVSNLSSSRSSSLTSSLSSSKSSSSAPADFPIGTVDNLPVLNLNTDGGVAIVSKDDYVTGSFTLTELGVADVTGTLEVRGRGNSTWAWPKKPYRLKLTSSTELLGMPANKHWILLANYIDKTLVRNDVAFMMSRRAGMEYTVRNKYVELKLNGVYQGVYQLTEHIRIATDRVNIPELKVSDVAEDKVSGGYLMEIDYRLHKNYCANNAWDEVVCKNGVNVERDSTLCLDSSYGMNPACLANPETLLEPTWSAQREYIQKYYADMEAALFGSNFTDPATGYAAYIDVDSAINYYLINELFRNVDGAITSFFLYKKRSGKLFFGPIWDFDLSMGNAGYDNLEKTYGCHIRKVAWFDRLFQDPAFREKVKVRWNAMKADGTLNDIPQYAKARATWLEKQQVKNYSIWPFADSVDWVQHFNRGSYALEVKELIRWLEARTLWMDRYVSHATMSCNVI